MNSPLPSTSPMTAGPGLCPKKELRSLVTLEKEKKFKSISMFKVNKVKVLINGGLLKWGIVATLLEGAGCFFFKTNFKVNSFIILRWKKCVNLVNTVV